MSPKPSCSIWAFTPQDCWSGPALIYFSNLWFGWSYKEVNQMDWSVLYTSVSRGFPWLLPVHRLPFLWSHFVDANHYKPGVPNMACCRCSDPATLPSQFDPCQKLLHSLVLAIFLLPTYQLHKLTVHLLPNIQYLTLSQVLLWYDNVLNLTWF